eukprot:GFYU01008616.1.p1 GENE.GFYU01008616.1~~GFYU01008616.1.p1  ORF type:complete len:272 (+),score=65.26 GFYU01008616.1:96-911(+)
MGCAQGKPNSRRHERLVIDPQSIEEEARGINSTLGGLFNIEDMLRQFFQNDWAYGIQTPEESNAVWKYVGLYSDDWMQSRCDTEGFERRAYEKVMAHTGFRLANRHHEWHITIADVLNVVNKLVRTDFEKAWVLYEASDFDRDGLLGKTDLAETVYDTQTDGVLLFKARAEEKLASRDMDEAYATKQTKLLMKKATWSNCLKNANLVLKACGKKQYLTLQDYYNFTQRQANMLMTMKLFHKNIAAHAGVPMNYDGIHVADRTAPLTYGYPK